MVVGIDGSCLRCIMDLSQSVLPKDPWKENCSFPILTPMRLPLEKISKEIIEEGYFNMERLGLPDP